MQINATLWHLHRERLVSINLIWVGKNRLNGGNVTSFPSMAALSVLARLAASFPAHLLPFLCHVSDGTGAIQSGLDGFILNTFDVCLALK